MFKIKVILAITAICYFLEAIHANVEVVKKLKEFPGRDVLFSDYSFKDALIVYAVCDRDEPWRNKRCTINQEVSPYENVSRSCKVEVESSCEHGQITDLFVGALNPDTAIISWLEEGSTIIAHMGTLDLNKCTVRRVTIEDREDNKPIIYWQLKNARTIVRYKDFFDIFYNNANLDGREMKMRLNAKGYEVIGGILAMNRLPYYVSQLSSINSTNPLQGVAYKRFNEKDVSYLIQIPVNLVDTEKKLTTSPEAIIYDLISTSDNKINVYFKGIGPRGSTKGNMTLLQYDADGNNVLTTNLSDISNSMQVLNIYNLPEGGSILLVADVEDGIAGCSKVKTLHLVKIDAAGKKVGEIQMQGPDSKTFYQTPMDRHWRYIWKIKQGGYCATIVGPTVKCTLTDVSLEDNLQIIENCFTDADFFK